MSRTRQSPYRFSINELAALSGHTWRTVRQRIARVKPAGQRGADPVYGVEALRSLFDCYSAEAAAASRKAEAEAIREELAAIAGARAVLPREYIAAALGVVLAILRQEDLGPRADEITERILDRLCEIEDGGALTEPPFVKARNG